MTAELDLTEANAALGRLAMGANYAHDVRLLRMALERLKALSTPPADDIFANNVGELLGEARELVASWDLRGSWTSESPIGLVARLADALEVAAVRPHGTVTDAADVDSHLRAALAKYLDLRTVARIMAALEAAREARS